MHCDLYVHSVVTFTSAKELSPVSTARVDSDRFLLPVNTGRVDGRAFPLAELTGRH